MSETFYEIKNHDCFLHFTDQKMSQLRIYLVSLKTSDKILHDQKYLQALKVAEQALGPQGRLVVRKSGTEPLIRLMAQGYDVNLLHKVLDTIAEVITKQSHIPTGF